MANLFLSRKKNPEFQQNNYQDKTDFSEGKYLSIGYQNTEDKTKDALFLKAKHFEADEKKGTPKLNDKVSIT